MRILSNIELQTVGGGDIEDGEPPEDYIIPTTFPYSPPPVSLPIAPPSYTPTSTGPGGGAPSTPTIVPTGPTVHLPAPVQGAAGG